MSGRGTGNTRRGRRLGVVPGDCRERILINAGAATARPTSPPPAAKRAIDIAVALTALVVLMPMMLAIALLVVLESRGPVFYRANRIGFSGAPLLMLKFRKMRADAAGPPLSASAHDRLPRVGSVLVGTRLDELPQLWLVLRGEMSLVGPRPEDPRFVVRYGHEYQEILVRPGLTGWTQIAFPREPRILSPVYPLGDYLEVILPAKVARDRTYAANPTLGCDLRILWSTFLTVVLRRSLAVNRASGAMTLRGARLPDDLAVRERRALVAAGFHCHVVGVYGQQVYGGPKAAHGQGA